MSWLHRLQRTVSPRFPARDEPERGGGDRVSPGLTTLFHGMAPDRSHAVLDLGPVADSSLRVYSRFARSIHFADLLALGGGEEVPESPLQALPPRPEHPYDLVFVWNALDWIEPEERRAVVERLVVLTTAEARLLVTVETSSETPRPPLRFSVLDEKSMRIEPAGPARPALPPLLPAEVGRLFRPIQIAHAYTSQAGIREYVAVRQTGPVRPAPR